MSYDGDPDMSKNFSLDDFKLHFENIQKMGTKKMIGQMPGMAEMIREGEDPDVALNRVRGMIDAMTERERQAPETIGAEQLRRIAADSGVEPQEVRQFLDNFAMVQKLMNDMRSMSTWQRIKAVLGIGRLPPLPPPG